MRTSAQILILALVLSVDACAQQKEAGIGWDLSYTSVLEGNNVAKTEWIWKWVQQYKSPAEKWITDWKGEPIVSSILVEYPAFHAAEHTTMWFVRTKDEAFYWESIEGSEADQNEEPIALQLYDELFRQTSSWQQLLPKTAAELPEQALPGYFGFLNIQGLNVSRQMLLTMDDFFICLDKTCVPGRMKSGRFFEAIEPVLIPESRKTYKHSSEAEIKGMTPEQRIDEEYRESDNHATLMDPKDMQSDLIRKYRRMDGLKGWQHLIALMDGYNPKRVRDTRFHGAAMIAIDIDENVIRLRASQEGKHVIDAIERLAARISEAGQKSTLTELDLPNLKGVNSTDIAIQYTLRVKHRIRLSDDELLSFSNYLVKHHPTYPGWSKTDFIRQDLPDQPGDPTQFHVMKDSKRFLDAYKTFKLQ